MNESLKHEQNRNILSPAFDILQVEATHPDCSIIHHLQQQEAQCLERIQLENHSSLILKAAWVREGCWSEWDGVNCWAASPVGETLSVTCPDILPVLKKPKVLIQRNCTENGWTAHSPPYYTACELSSSGIDMEEKKGYFATVKVLYTCGYAASLAALIIAISIFSLFRKLYCTRNFIHIHLFASFVFRGAAVFSKDAVLFADEDVDHCTMSTVNCKAVVVFFQYSVLANFSWLLVEGMYLQTLLIFTFISDKQYFWWYIFIGWGTPMLTILVWIVTRLQYDDIGCWDDYENIYWWIIKAPILFAILVNFFIFLNVIRILVQKIRCPDIGTNYKQQYMRLVKSTLLLIPLFGVHYVVFALFPEHTGVEVRLYFELVLGSYQGFIVALLYCFLNGEVQTEVKRRWRKCRSSMESNVFNLVTQEFTA
ncbi:vasoactive intestinal polypeptide receptor 1-like [Microcaecilia unicolor]|uniref:Vasoactive intestinal polypeptide receptor 1-like n=1 Tax=Microcaecilia unicolor TaxID=1415580 RepID=A0A6P7ZQ91_9AMPH|nr:vasoactive intestinal polypeptide receptor 1-like [Microcaecilia unicolor]